jgi:hypothetical protein
LDTITIIITITVPISVGAGVPDAIIAGAADAPLLSLRP